MEFWMLCLKKSNLKIHKTFSKDAIKIKTNQLAAFNYTGLF